MIQDDVVEAFNTRFTVDLNNYKKFTPAQRDQAKKYGSDAEALLKNRELALFVHHFKFDLADSLITIPGHSPDDNCRRVSVANQLAGMDAFIATLKRAVMMKNRIIEWESNQSQ
ncbi:hypothetical protein UFOVP841_33 [uncultured Caudovirales phage]|uniref:Uncharacterized protein n=1 Tax=uncultured Caudovirales phage TaxID=2100421 RepID=A0A6J5P8G2_9CAUD|nr:hypothetical protein UFOVP841_33 [uncultured Caudovirales phage]